MNRSIIAHAACCVGRRGQVQRRHLCWSGGSANYCWSCCAQRAQVHEGFLEAYDSVRLRTFRAMDDAMSAAGDNGAASVQGEGWHVFVCGHSLARGEDGSPDALSHPSSADPSTHPLIHPPQSPLAAQGGALATLFSAELGESVTLGRRKCQVRTRVVRSQHAAAAAPAARFPSLREPTALAEWRLSCVDVATVVDVTMRDR